jgi:hypothetical protein
MSIVGIKFSLILWGLPQLLRIAARRHSHFRKRLRERDLVAQIIARDEEIGRWIEFRKGTIRSRRGMHPQPDVTLAFKNAAVGAGLMMPPINWLNQINAQKDFKLSHRATKTCPTGSRRL